MSESDLIATRERVSLYLRLAAMTTIPLLASELRRRANALAVSAALAERAEASAYQGTIH